MLGRFVLAVVLLAAPFFFGGIALATLFRRSPEQMPRLYMADLVGAAAGVLVAVWLMNGLGTPHATVASALPVLVAALLVCRNWLRIVPLALVVASIPLAQTSESLLQQQRDERAPVIYQHWDAMAKIKVYDYGPEYRGINIDNVANTGVYGFDGNWNRAEPFQFGIDVGYLLGLFESPTFLSLGAGGGSDVLQALQYGAGEVHAVEVNPHINRMLLEGDPSGYRKPEPQPEKETLSEESKRTGEKATEGESHEERDRQLASSDDPESQDDTKGSPEEEQAAAKGDQQEEGPEEPQLESHATPWPPPTLAEFSGHLYSDPRVNVVTVDARAYVRRFQGEFDFIYSLSSNTFAALASGSFAMAESYLFTTEAFRDYWRALSPGGFMMMEHQFYMPRLVSSLVDALESEGVENPRSHFAVYDLPKMRRNMILLSKRQLTDEIRTLAFGELTEEKFEDIHLLYPAPDGLEDNLINRIVTVGWRAAADEAGVEISPTTDDRPFVGQMGRWKNLTKENLEKMRPLEVFGLPLAKMIILAILAVVLVLLIPLNLLPYFKKGPRLRAAPWTYFFLIGAAFMAVEVVLIQQFTLFVGPAAYSIATILLVLLLASGIGSRFSTRVSSAAVFWGIAVWIVVDIAVFSWVAGALAALPAAVRIALTALAVAPLGFLMGMPFPKGAVRVGELVDWGFAVNGAASVLGATGILLLAFSYGLSAALATGAVLYLVAYWMLCRRGAWASRAGPAEARAGVGTSEHSSGAEA
jgi:hypothetical protein